jgi:hypothetical protein
MHVVPFRIIHDHLHITPVDPTYHVGATKQTNNTAFLHLVFLNTSLHLVSL